MREGWLGDEYLVLFDESEIESVSARYKVSEALTGHEIIGLRSWDDFIVRDKSGRTFTVPTVPLNHLHLASYALPGVSAALESDARYEGKVKWYIKPVVFSGDPSLEANVTWIDHIQHSQLVVWWNELYRSVQGSQPGT